MKFWGGTFSPLFRDGADALGPHVVDTTLNDACL